MGIAADEPCPRPMDPVLDQFAVAMDETGQAAWIVDDHWRFVYATDDARATWPDTAGGRLGSVPLGHHIFSGPSLEVWSGWRFGPNCPDFWREFFLGVGGLVLADTAGGADELRAVVHESVRDLVDELVPSDDVSRGIQFRTMGLRGPLPGVSVAIRITDRDGVARGAALIGKPAAPMSVLGGLVWEQDLGHLTRMQRFTRAGRHPAAILFADIEGSSTLMRSIPTAVGFTMSRRVVRVADQCVVAAGGLVGRHLGDGVVAYFPVETSGSESRAARGCIDAARSIRASVNGVAERSGLDPDALVMRFGLHWGATLYIGKISTLARAEVTAMGDDMNETARIEQSAVGGRVLASKQLIERLDPDDAADLGIDPAAIAYTPLGSLDTATAKTRRDAATIAVCEL